MVLASGFRGSMLRLPLSGMVYREIATRTLDTRLRVIKAGTEGGEESWLEAPIAYAPATKPCRPAVKILRQLLTFVKNDKAE